MLSDPRAIDPRTLVVLDDNPRFLALVKSMLREFGFDSVYDTTDPREAFTLMATHWVDAVLFDLVMPGVNGFQFAERVRHADVIVNRIVPMVLMTGEADMHNIRNAIRFGIDEVIAKPFSPAALHRKLLAVLEKPRVYLKTPTGYFGPDRRRRNDPSYRGPERRLEDAAEIVTPEIATRMIQETRRKYGPARSEADPTGPIERIPARPVGNGGRFYVIPESSRREPAPRPEAPSALIREREQGPSETHLLD